MKIYTPKNRRSFTGIELKNQIERLRKNNGIISSGKTKFEKEYIDFLLQFASKITVYNLPTLADILKYFKGEDKEESKEFYDNIHSSYSPFVIIEYKKKQNKPKYKAEIKDKVHPYYGADGEETVLALSINYVDLNNLGYISKLYPLEDYRYWDDINSFGKKTMKDELLDVLQGFDEY